MSLVGGGNPPAAGRFRETAATCTPALLITYIHNLWSASLRRIAPVFASTSEGGSYSTSPRRALDESSRALASGPSSPLIPLLLLPPHPPLPPPPIIPLLLQKKVGRRIYRDLWGAGLAPASFPSRSTHKSSR